MPLGSIKRHKIHPDDEMITHSNLFSDIPNFWIFLIKQWDFQSYQQV